MKMLDFDWSVCMVKNFIDLCLHCSVVRFKRSKNDDSRTSLDKFSELAFSFSLYKPFDRNYYFEEMKLTWNMCYETVKKERTFYLGKSRIRSLYLHTSSILKNEHQELQIDEQHQIETKNTRITENCRTRRPRDRCESVCWTWPGHRFFILIFDNYIEIGNESIYKRIKVLIKFVCKLPFKYNF